MAVVEPAVLFFLFGSAVVDLTDAEFETLGPYPIATAVTVNVDDAPGAKEPIVNVTTPFACEYDPCEVVAHE